MNNYVPSGKDGVHVYVLPQEEKPAADESGVFNERYLIIREVPQDQECWSEIVIPNLEGENDA